MTEETTDILDSVSILSMIDKKYLTRLLDIAIYCINEAIDEDLSKNKTVTDLDIGIGDLHVSYVSNELKFKFIPNAKLKEGIIDTIKGKHNNLEFTLDKKLIDKLTNVYKEIF